MEPQASLIEIIFSDSHAGIPEALRYRYFNRPFSTDKIEMNGVLNIKTSKFYQFISPLFRLGGALVSYPGENIPVKVELISDEKSNAVTMSRTFYYSEKNIRKFSSKIIYLKNNEVLELMRFRLGAKLKYYFENKKIKMEYGGYALYLGKWVIPLPLGFMLGTFSAWEEAISTNQFKMQFTMKHFIFGKMFEYAGIFKIDKSL